MEWKENIRKHYICSKLELDRNRYYEKKSYETMRKRIKRGKKNVDVKKRHEMKRDV